MDSKGASASVSSNSTAKLYAVSKFMKLPDIRTIPKPFEYDTRNSMK
jgi:hypothetical protein